ncbi:MAG: single-stranded-DNA-specific exonuclease RecJ [Patescibacteria group bacterium]
MEEYPELLRTLLLNRGITTKDEAERFLYPDYERDLHDPFLILHMERAVERILKAVADQEKIVIWGDYDCDGIPGSVVLHDFFQKIGYAHFSNYIPHRYLEGYGLNIPGIEKLAAEGAKLIVTVDSGITDVEQVARANELGVDVIVTDHHLPQEVLPNAYAVLNSKQAEDTYPFPFLSGAGVAFKLVQALLLRGGFDVKTGWEKWLLDVAGLSTIADMVPLVGENRALAHFGLRVLRRTPRLGLQALYRNARLNPDHLTEDDVGFTIGPRINAASRMGEPIRAFEMLSTRDPLAAGMMAAYLEEKNDERKYVVSEMIAEVDALVAARSTEPVLVVGSPSWRPGVVGLAASRIVERYGRTAFVWGGEGCSDLKGSCRSDGTVNIVELMRNAEAETFLGFGGHEQAGGFSVHRDRIGALEERLMVAHRATAPLSKGKSERLVDAALSLDAVTWDTYRLIEQLAPYGEGNPKPIFSFEVRPTASRRFGKKKEHLEVTFKKESGEPVNAIQFFSSNELPRPGEKMSMLAHIEKNTFKRTPELRLRIVEA